MDSIFRSDRDPEPLSGDTVEVLARAEIDAWKAQNYKDMDGLKAAMTKVFMLLYGVEEEVAEEAASWLAIAAIEHDKAEEVEDAGEDSTAEWNGVRDTLSEMYEVLVSGMNAMGFIDLSDDLSVSQLAGQVATHDAKRWRVHHIRNYDSLMEEMAQMYVLLFGVEYEDAYKLMKYVVSALRWHDLAEETGVAREIASYNQEGLFSIEQHCWNICIQNYKLHYAELANLLTLYSRNKNL
ncbi:hypothetical protein H6764_00485 [Candidatus Nomurabacteria bacterium]|nr:hypothetical protein [Candidatus Nomurabacteria bacterium]